MTNKTIEEITTNPTLRAEYHAKVIRPLARTFHFLSEYELENEIFLKQTSRYKQKEYQDWNHLRACARIALKATLSAQRKKNAREQARLNDPVIAAMFYGHKQDKQVDGVDRLARLFNASATQFKGKKREICLIYAKAVKEEVALTATSAAKMVGVHQSTVSRFLQELYNEHFSKHQRPE